MASIENRVGILPSIDPTDSANFSFLLIRLSLQQEMIVRQLNVTTVNKKRSNCCEMKEIFPNLGFVTERIEEELRENPSAIWCRCPLLFCRVGWMRAQRRREEPRRGKFFFFLSGKNCRRPKVGQSCRSRPLGQSVVSSPPPSCVYLSFLIL